MPGRASQSYNHWCRGPALRGPHLSSIRSTTAPQLDMRRRLLTAAVFLLVGAVVNMAVAWGCAAWVNVVAQEYNESAEVRGSEEVWGARVWRRAGAELCTSSRVARAGSPRTGLTEIPQQAAAIHPRDILPNRSFLTVPTKSFLSGATNHDHKGVSSRGWPLLSMSCEYDFNPTRLPSFPCRRGFPPGSMIRVSSGSSTGAIEPSWKHGPYLSGLPRALPLRPIPGGFAVNTVFYGATLWLMICGLFALRRFIRVRRGLCAACGYPMGESAVCSECGKPLPGRAGVAT